MVNTKKEKWIATGRRKSSIARVAFKKGKGTFVVNGRDFNEYFPRSDHFIKDVKETASLTYY